MHQEALLRARSEELSDQLLTRAEELARTNRRLAATIGPAGLPSPDTLLVVVGVGGMVLVFRDAVSGGTVLIVSLIVAGIWVANARRLPWQRARAA